MPKKIIYITLCFIFAHCFSFGQTTSSDTIQSIEANYFFAGHWMPGHYHDLLDKLNLPPITQQADSFALRLWVGSMLGYELIVLNKTKDKWNYHKYQHHGPSNITEIKLQPKISLSSFIDSLQRIDFEKLISQNTIANFTDNVDDGVMYTLEIGYPHRYKIVQYHSPEAFADKEINNKKFLSIIQWLNQYFSP